MQRPNAVQGLSTYTQWKEHCSASFIFFLSCTCLCFLKHQVTYLYPVPFTAVCQNRFKKNCYLQKSIKCPTILQTPSPKVLIRIQAVSSPHSQWKEAWAVARSTDSWRSWFLEIFWWRGSRFSHGPTEGASKNENTEVGKRQNNLNENWSYKPPVTEIGELN